MIQLASIETYPYLSNHYIKSEERLRIYESYLSHAQVSDGRNLIHEYDPKLNYHLFDVRLGYSSVGISIVTVNKQSVKKISLINII